MSQRLRIKLASALLALGDIPYEDAKQMSPEQIISLYQFDHHPIRDRDGGPFEPWNLRPMLISAHREKTARHDQPDMAKERKVGFAADAHEMRMAAKMYGVERDFLHGSYFECTLVYAPDPER